MTQSSYFLTNGSSLEDCHTNFFALADLCGIKWRQYTCDKHHADVNEDPILCSYAKCISADLLCVWRRVRANNTQEQPNRELPYIDYTKELWVFWYGEEPDFADLLSNHLTEIESGQGSWESGLSYECRSILFKALHNLIEKCLLSKGYSRLGNSFFLISNSTLSDILKKGIQVTFAFNFFLHGDSTVCVNVDVRQHAALRRITKEDVQLAQQMNGIKVLLSPYGLQGYMTGYVYNDSDQHVQKFLSDWNKIYPLSNVKNFKESGIHIPSPFNHMNLGQNSSSSKDDFLNKVIEVIVGDCKMKYPVNYVFITEADSKFSRQKLRYNNDRIGAMKQLENLYKEEEELLTTSKLAMTPYNNRIPSYTNLLKSRANLIINQCDLAFVDDDQVGDEDSSKEDNTKSWDCPQSACSKRNCNCQVSSHNKTRERVRAKLQRHSNLFHHRPATDVTQEDASMLLILSSSQTNADSILNNASVSINSSTVASSVAPIMSYKSPVSTSTSSILNTPGIESSPMSNLPLDPNEHVSPNSLLAVKEEPGLIPTPTNNLLTSPKDRANFGLHSPNLTSNECDSNAIKLPDNSGHSNELNHTNCQQNPMVPTSDGGSTNGIKRPYRFKGLFEDNEHDLRTGLLYDFSCEADNVWDIPAPKNRRKVCDTIEPESELHRVLLDKDSYDIPEIDEKDSKINSSIIFYSKNASTLSTQVNGLLPESTYKFHLAKQKILENGDVNGKNKLNCHEENACDYFNSPDDESNGSKNPDTEMGAESDELGPADLSKMFPTPPSFENMIASPSNANSEQKCDKNESHNDADRSDQSASPNGTEKAKMVVYEPPKQSMFITSNKYAPLENVDLKQTLPANCYYKHNSKKQSVKGHSLQSHSPSLSQFPLNPMFNKSKSFGPAPNRSSFPNAMYRNPRMNGQSMPINSNYLNRMRPPMNMQQASPMYPHVGNVMPSENFNSFRQNSPSLVDGSPMNNYISSPLPNFDNRKSPFPFGQQSLNSPSASIAMNNSPMNNYAIQQQKMSTSMMAPGMYNNFSQNQNMESNGLMATAAAFYEANSLMLNLLLSDSMLNLFRDHNFDSCSICVCNMNIKGNDVGIYLPDLPQSQAQSSYDYIPCSCGFSAVSNRHHSQFSGLFFEDELEITEQFYDPSERNELVENHYFDKDLKKALGESDETLIDLVLSQTSTIFPSCSTLARLAYCDNVNSWKTFNPNKKENTLQAVDRNPLNLVYRDFAEVICQCLSMVRCDSNGACKPGMLMPTHNMNRPMRPVLHHWSFRRASFPVNSQQVMLMLKTLQPLMQESVQRKGSGNEVTYNTVKGPLTWRQFHRLAGRGTECQCEPQPIPSLLVGYDKDSVTMSPFGLKNWLHMQIEPYAITRDVYYVVISPNNISTISGIRDYFKELNCIYESLRFGRHTPLTKLAPDGIYVLPNSDKSETNRPYSLDDWFNQIGDSLIANKVRAYARSLFDLIPHLSVCDRSLFETNHSTKQENPSIYNSNANSTPVAMNGNLSSSFIPNNTNNVQNCQPYNSLSQQKQLNNYGQLNSSENQPERISNDVDSHNHSHDSNHQPSSVCQLYEDEEELKQPSIIIYIVEPFSTLGKEATRLGAISLLKAFLRMKKHIDKNMHNNVHLQLLSLASILAEDKDFRGNSRNAQLKELSFSTYSLCKYHLTAQPGIKSLTGLGPAASFRDFLKEKDDIYKFAQLFTTPYILAPMKDKQTELGEMFGDRTERSQILFCCYCLSEDQKWLLASCTNDKGDILQTQAININIPNRTRRRNASVRRFALDKLMKFVQAVMSESVLPWRLVIGRLGRIGHGELKDWTFLLSKKSLLKYSRQLREMCDQCNHLSSQDQPAIYSACLISLEADTSLRVFPNFYTPDERFSSSCNTCSLSTPEDASCTHILVFPTSATTQSSHTNCMDNLGAIADDFFSNFQVDDQDIQEDGMDGIFDNLFNDDIPDGPHPDSPGNRQSFHSKTASLLEEQDEPSQLLQQPLALAFYVSTVRTGPLPKWFWANCPHLEHNCPTFLKSALLIHTPFVQQNTDDLLHSNNRDCHSLDSNLTTDVLRYALEGYNALSWTVLDPATSDRLSCLPLHIQVLMQLYHSVQALI